MIERHAGARLGPDAVETLLPHRRPFLMVDRVDAYDLERRSMHACRHISINEPVFAGHFPGFSVWPGVLTIEGLGQTCHLLAAVLFVDATAKRLGYDDGLTALLSGSPPADLVAAVGRSEDHVGLSSSVDIKFLHPVSAGERLDYSVSQTHVEGRIMRFDVEAFVDRRPVARGRMTGAIGAAT